MKKWIQWFIIGMFLPVFVYFTFFTLANNAPDKMTYNEFIEHLNEGEVEHVTISAAEPTFTFLLREDKQLYITDNPRQDGFKEKLLIHDVDVKEKPVSKTRPIDLLSTGLFILFLLVIIYFYRKQSNIGKSDRTKPIRLKSKVTFNHLAGNDEAKAEMQFLVDFLKNPKKYHQMGAKLPKGVLLYGSPGTGKTLTAKAIAGEADVPFFSMSGSDFVEMYVGVGAKRVRKLFEEARKNSPSIIFIDEIDALGSNRDLDNNSERKQTLNAILNELDGFDESDNVIVIGATNRIDDLDPAFIRPGRFDKHIAIDLPDTKSRLEILKVHAKNKRFEEDVDLEALAKMTIGMSGAYLESILNEAAILATQRGLKKIRNEEVDDAFYKVVMKGLKKTSGDKREWKERELIAWHEAGHALVTKLLTNNSVPKVTIIPSTSGAGGVTFITPNKMGLMTKQELLSSIQCLYAGRAAEFLLTKDDSQVTTGASNDIQQATQRIKAYLTDYGFSSHYGMIDIRTLKGTRHSPVNDAEFVNEARKLSINLYEKTIELLEENIECLKEISDNLMEKETLSEDKLDAIIEKHNITRRAV